MPVEVMGLNGVPGAGDVFQVVPSEREARIIVAEREQLKTKEAASKKAGITLEQLFDKFQAGDIRELRVVLKADVQGSLEPIVSTLNDLSKGDIKIHILHAETGNIGENDVMLASASKAVILGFNVQADSSARRLAEAVGRYCDVRVDPHSVSHNLLTDWMPRRRSPGLLFLAFVGRITVERVLRKARQLR